MAESDRAYEILAGVCERMGWKFELDSMWHDHGFDREGWLYVWTPELFLAHKAAGETWDQAARRLMDDLHEAFDPFLSR